MNSLPPPEPGLPSPETAPGPSQPGTQEWDRLLAPVQPQLRALHRMEVAATLAQGVTHEFNNLLLAIRGNVALLQMGEPLEPLVQRRLEQIEAAAARATELTRQFQALARPGSGKPALTSFAEVVREAVALAGLGTRRRVTFQLEEDGGPLPVLMDRSSAVRVLLALCLNAAEAMPEGGRVTLTTDTGSFAPGSGGRGGGAPGRTFVRCRIQDAGPGVDPEQQARFFSPFYTTKPAGRGTGLGLAMVRDAVEAEDGWLELASAPEAGTVVSVCLPMACTGLAP
ncbi:MAG: hypothetical protein RJA22_1902 [Verrucomicrobiota bacterium]